MADVDEAGVMGGRDFTLPEIGTLAATPSRCGGIAISLMDFHSLHIPFLSPSIPRPFLRSPRRGILREGFHPMVGSRQLPGKSSDDGVEAREGLAYLAIWPFPGSYASRSRDFSCGQGLSPLRCMAQ